MAELAYSAQVINIVAQDFSRGVVGIATTAFFEALIRSVKEMQAHVTALEARVQALETP